MEQPNRPRTQVPQKPQKKVLPNKTQRSDSKTDPANKIIESIDSYKGLQEYSIKEMVEQTEPFGKELAKKLKTNQIRKFLDAVNLLKAKLNKKKISEKDAFDELHLLRPKLAYAARQTGRDASPVKPLKRVLEVAIQKIRKEPEFFREDFNRFAQLIESIIAYHKAEGGRNQ